ncbi:MAG: hypothetical protein WCF85_00550 [Rhodospirillaceae bacterium]
MKAIGVLGTVLMLGSVSSASGACINNHTDATLYVDQYSLVSEEDVFAVAPGQRLCREHSGLIHRYTAGVIPYGDKANTKLFYLTKNSDELLVEGTCPTGRDCRKSLKFMRTDGAATTVTLAEHVAH